MASPASSSIARNLKTWPQPSRALSASNGTPAVLRRHAENFGTDVFQARFRTFLAKVGAPVPEAALLPFNPVSRAATAELGIPVQEGVPA